MPRFAEAAAFGARLINTPMNIDPIHEIAHDPAVQACLYLVANGFTYTEAKDLMQTDPDRLYAYAAFFRQINGAE
jgi:hypothetical protein